MTTATITKLIKDRGFGFCKDDQDQLYFFHYSAVDPKSKTDFDKLTEGQVVQFISEDSPKGPRAKPRTLSKINGDGNANSQQV
jgi:cold shock CspA family protein